MMAKKGTFYVGRVLKLGLLNQEMLINAILNPKPIKIRETAWTIIAPQEHNLGPNKFYTGKLTKYAPKGEVTIIDEEKRREVLQAEPNLGLASSHFIYIPEHSGIAFLNIYNHIDQKTFTNLFSKIIEETYEGFFVRCEIELISDLKSFAAKLSGLEKIYQIKAKISPPNPLFGPLWAPLKDYLISRNTDRMSISEEAPEKQSILTDIQNIVQQAAEQKEEELYFTDKPIPIGDAAILMAADGYGNGEVKGSQGDELIVIKTSETAKNFIFEKNPDALDLYYKLLPILEEIQKNRHMRH